MLHGSFENYASDENLPADHWFWDRGKSGGILLTRRPISSTCLPVGWGPVVEAAQVGVRPGPAIEEHVHATVRHGDTGLVNPLPRLPPGGTDGLSGTPSGVERGDITLFDWIPTRACIHALADERQTRELIGLFPGAQLDVAVSYGGADRACRGRGKPIDAYQLIDLSFGDGQAKTPLYGRLLRSMMEDQVAWIRDRRHQRVVTEENGRNSLATACEANALAHRAGAGR